MLDHKDFLISLGDLKLQRIKKSVMEEDLKELNSTIKGTVFDLVEYLENTDQLSVKVKGLGTASLSSTKQYSIDRDTPGAAEAFEGFMKDKGDWQLVTAVHASKLKGYYKECLDNGEEVPPGVKTFIKNNITIRG